MRPVSINNKIKLMKITNEVCNEYSLPPIPLEITGRLKAANGIFHIEYVSADMKKAKTRKEILDAMITKKIKISSRLFEFYGYGEAEKTLKHELAHYINYVYNKSNEHDKNFKDLCVKLGGNMNEFLATGEYKESKCENWVSDKVGYLYSCPCGEFEYKTVRKVAEKMMSRYCCPKCKTYIKKFSVTKKG